MRVEAAVAAAALARKIDWAETLGRSGRGSSHPAAAAETPRRAEAEGEEAWAEHPAYERSEVPRAPEAAEEEAAEGSDASAVHSLRPASGQEAEGEAPPDAFAFPEASAAEASRPDRPEVRPGRDT